LILCPKKKSEEELVSFALSADDDAWRENLSDSEDVDDENDVQVSPSQEI
jgi:hypothetical protein